MKDSGKALLFLIPLVFLLTRFSFAAEDWIQQSIDLTINARFDSAESVVRPHLDNPQERLPAWFYLSSILNSKMTHYEAYDHPQRFLAALDTVLKYSEGELNRKNIPLKDKARLLFYRGSALGYKAFYQGRCGQWLAGLNNGLHSVTDLQQAVTLDSTLYEAYLGIGVYQYWRSTKLKLLLWTPFVSDLREQGIANIKKAVRFGRHSRYMAMHQLIYILVNYRHFDEAWHYAQEAVAAYPHSPFMRWAYAHTLFMMHKNRQAAVAYTDLLKMIAGQKQKNPAHLLTCYVRLAEIYQRMGMVGKCREQLQQVSRFDRKTLSQSGRKELEKARTLWQHCAAGGGKAAVGFR